MVAQQDPLRGSYVRCAHNSQLLDTLAEDNRLNVYAGELEVRPLGAPTILAL